MPTHDAAGAARPLLCIGHRGAAGHEPENTLRSVAAALRMGAQAIEVDVYFVDGHLVVIHDDRLERTTDGTGRVMDCTFAQLRALDAGKGERIPTLEEVIELIDRRAQLIVELKGPGTAEPAVTLLDALGAGGARRDEFLLSSFDHHALARAQRTRPAIRRAPLITGVPLGYAKFAEALAPHSVHVSLEFLRPEFVADAHRRGLEVYVYTVNHPADLAHVRSLGVDGAFTDYPDRCVPHRSSAADERG